MDNKKTSRDIFHEGAIPADMIAQSIAAHQSKTGIGAHSIFLGQVRADSVGENQVAAIEYTAYRDMALEQMQRIREEIITRFGLSCLHVHHSIGRVAAGGICLFVFTSSPHRQAAMEACNETVERIKKELPIWGREIFADQGHQWKTNV